MLNKAKIILWVGAALYALWAIVMLIMNAVSYSSYIDYYGLGQVLPSILDGFFGYASWAFVLFGLGALCGYFANKEQKPAVPIDEESVAEEKIEQVVETA